MTMSAARLTLKRLRAIEEALNASLAGPMDKELCRADYERALEWAQEQIDKRTNSQ
jgi:hypothetical protein